MLTASQRQVAEAHVAAIARRNNIVVRRTKPDYGSCEADAYSRQVFIPKVFTSVIDYIVSLHEIAHLVHRSADTASEYEPSLGTCMRIEAAAWGWALDRALPEVLTAMTKTDRRRMGFCWASHSGPIWPPALP